MTAGNSRASMKVPSEAQYIREVSSKINDSLSRYKVEEEKLFEIKLCVEEALRNAMVHGNDSDARKMVSISYEIDPKRVSIEISDEGNGFDHKKLPDPTKDENITRTYGRGVFLIKKFMDKVEFAGSGNIIKMTKNF
jgi:serine/threonine-protein kinase RsbW